MLQLKRRSIVGQLTKVEVEKLVPRGTFTCTLKKLRWRKIVTVLEGLSNDVQERIQKAAVAKKRVKSKKRKQEKEILVKGGKQNKDSCGDEVDKETEIRSLDEVERTMNEDCLSTIETLRFMDLPGEEEESACYRAFREATSNEALSHSICVVCGRKMWSSEGKFIYIECRVMSCISQTKLLMGFDRQRAFLAHYS